MPVLLIRSIVPVVRLTVFTETCPYEDDIWDRKELLGCQSQSGDMMGHLERGLSSCYEALRRVENLYAVPQALAAAGSEVQMGFINLRTGVGAQRDSNETSQPFQAWKSAIGRSAKAWRIMGHKMLREADLVRDTLARLRPDLDAVAGLDHVIGYTLGFDDGVAKHKQLGVELKTVAFKTVEVVDRVRLAARAMNETFTALLATQSNLTHSIIAEKAMIDIDLSWRPPGAKMMTEEPNAYVPCKYWGMCRVLEPGPIEYLGPIAVPAAALQRASTELDRIVDALAATALFVESARSWTGYIARDAERTRDKLIMLTMSSYLVPHDPTAKQEMIANARAWRRRVARRLRGLAAVRGQLLDPHRVRDSCAQRFMDCGGNRTEGLPCRKEIQFDQMERERSQAMIEWYVRSGRI